MWPVPCNDTGCPWGFLLGLSLKSVSVIAVSCSSQDICTALAERLLSHNLQSGVSGLIRDIS